MRTLGSTRTTNLGLLFILVLSSCGRIFDAPSFFVTAQEDNVIGNNDVPVESPTTAPAPTPASECPLNCSNGAECKLGEHDFSFHPKEANGSGLTFLQTTSRDGWFCDCPAGFTGLRCNREYEVCPLELDNLAVAAGQDSDSNVDPHICYHGGSCIAGLTDGTNESIDSSQRYCDCAKAQHNGTPYFGKYCEIEGAIRCSDDSDQYCTAQGSCKEDAENKANPCECRVGHRGPHCEFMRGSVPECTLPCGGTTLNEDGTFTTGLGGYGECRLGIKEFENARYEDFWLDHFGNYQYCKCGDAWFGDDCEVPGVECGTAHCFNGGSCLESRNGNGDGTYACDCRDAGHNGLSWAGQYCENPETSNCNSQEGFGKLENANGHLFCTNGGTCKDPNNPHLGCDCPEGQYGPSCEFHKEEDAQCTLQCQNLGECRAGMKDNSLFKELGSSIGGSNETHHSELFEHCVCPHNFFGIQCEHKLEICPGGDHVCLHGSQCVAKNEGDSTADKHYVCDCDSAFDSLDKYAGKYCQYSSTDICTKNGQPGVGKANFAFCVNNGMCKGKVNDGEDPPGCTCPEGFYGEHCEYLEEEKEEDNGKFDGGFADDDQTPAVATTPASQSSQYSLEKQKVIIGLSVGVIIVVLIFMVVVARALFGAGYHANVKASLSEVETGSDSTPHNTSGIIHSQSGDDSLEDIEVDDYVNNHSNILTDNEMKNVQIV